MYLKEEQGYKDTIAKLESEKDKLTNANKEINKKLLKEVADLKDKYNLDTCNLKNEIR